MRSIALRLICLVLVASAGCGRHKQSARRHGADAVLIGHVRLEGAALPAYAALDLVRPPLHGTAPESVPAECAAANRDALTPVARVAGDALSGIVVAASDFTSFSQGKPHARRLAIEHCALQPAVMAAMAGDVLTLENHDAFGFEPLLGPAFRSAPLARGQKMLQVLAPGLERVTCSPRTPCGRSDIVVFRHPLFAVTDASGAFRIEHFPANEMVRIHAWHPLFEESETFVWVEPSTVGQIELTLSPKARFLAANAGAAHQ